MSDRGPLTGTAPDRAALKAAAGWYAHLRSGAATDADHAAWRRWRDADTHHRDAWDRVEALTRRFDGLPGRVSRTTLAMAAGDGVAVPGRRAALKAIAGALAVGGTAWAADQALPWPVWLADHRTGTGERAALRLDDGTALTLNTASAVDVVFTAVERRVTLRAGEILIETAPDPVRPPRPFVVETPHGRIRALGTRFTVRLDEAATRVAVLEDAVEVAAAGATRIVREGQGTRFTPAALEPPAAADPGQTSWTGGVLVAVDWRLGDLVAELARYRPGHLGCDAAVAGLRVSGAFPLADTDRALAALAGSLPVRVVRRTGYWVTVDPR